MKLDYSLKTTEERIECVNKILATTSPEKLNSKYLGYMSDYILFVADKNQTKKEHQQSHPIVTRNREVTVAKRQVSFEEMVSNLENGEDGLYALMTNDKNQIMDHKNPVSEKDVEEIPGLREHLDLIAKLKEQFEKATGQARYALKKQIIETWQQIYILKASYRGMPAKGKVSNQIKNIARMQLDEKITFNENGLPVSDGIISMFNPAHISFLLCYYPQLKEESAEDFSSDMHYLLLDLENLCEKTLKEDYPILWDLLIWKIDGKTNEEIQKLMDSVHGVVHNEQYFSTLWRKRIPKLLSEQAQKDYLNWYYFNEEYGTWKTCTKCGQTLLAHPMFFSRNTSKDGFYSQCKNCRSKKNK